MLTHIGGPLPLMLGRVGCRDLLLCHLRPVLLSCSLSLSRNSFVAWNPVEMKMCVGVCPLECG